MSTSPVSALTVAASIVTKPAEDAPLALIFTFATVEPVLSFASTVASLMVTPPLALSIVMSPSAAVTFLSVLIVMSPAVAPAVIDTALSASMVALSRTEIALPAVMVTLWLIALRAASFCTVMSVAALRATLPVVLTDGVRESVIVPAFSFVLSVGVEVVASPMKMLPLVFVSTRMSLSARSCACFSILTSPEVASTTTSALSLAAATVVPPTALTMPFWMVTAPFWFLIVTLPSLASIAGSFTDVFALESVINPAPVEVIVTALFASTVTLSWTVIGPLAVISTFSSRAFMKPVLPCTSIDAGAVVAPIFTYFLAVTSAVPNVTAPAASTRTSAAPAVTVVSPTVTFLSATSTTDESALRLLALVPFF